MKPSFFVHSPLFASVLFFFRAFQAYAGREGLTAAFLIGFGAILEGVGLAVLVPMLRLVVDGRFERLVLLMSGFALLVLLRGAVLWRRDIVMARLRIGFVEEQRTRLVAKLIEAPWPLLSGLRHAEINHLLSSDIALTGACVHFMMQSAVSFCLLTAQWLLAFFFSPVLAALTGVLLVMAGLALIPHLAKSRDLGKEVAEANLHLAGSGAAFLGGLKLAMSQNLQHRFAAEFNETLNRLMERQVSFTREQTRAQFAFATLSSFAGAAAILIGVGWLEIPPTVLIVFVLVLARMSGPAAQLQQGTQQFANFLPSFEKISALETELQSEPPPPESAVPPPSGKIVFEGVSYRHSAGGGGVSGLDLTIEPGTFLGISGPSGAGKTTFADLLVGLLTPEQGVISVGGMPLDEAGRRQWRSVVAYAPQETFLFHDTIRANLLWANPMVGAEEIEAALDLVGARPLLPRLDEVVGDKGLLLSGGERQRLALARALLRRASVLVLDETTSAIDIASERALFTGLISLPWKPAIVLIAHRAESLAQCDRIVQFAAGKIIPGGDANNPRPSRPTDPG